MEERNKFDTAAGEQPESSPDSRQLPPAYSRVLEAATGVQPWTAAEQAARNRSPRWLIAEAQAHVQLAIMETESSARDLELRAALDLIAKLPTPKMQATCFELVQTRLTGEAQERFSQLFQEIVASSTVRPAEPSPGRSV